MPVRILIVDDSTVMRAGLRAVLGRCPDLAVVGEATDGDEVPSAVAALGPDLVILDIGMARVGGIEAARQLSETAAAGAAGGPRILMLSLHCEEQMVAEAFRAGAMGYVVKTGISRDLIPAIRRVMAGGVFVGRGVGAATTADDGAGGLCRLPVVASALMRRLPPAASRLVDLIAEGHGDREAAGHLGLSEAATRSLSEWVLSQLSLSTRDELVELARERAVC